MKVFDMDSHLREEYIMDEVYRLEGKFAHLTPVRLAGDKNVRAKFKHELHPWPRDVVAHFNHSIVYDPQANWNGGDIARRQVARQQHDVGASQERRQHRHLGGKLPCSRRSDLLCAVGRNADFDHCDSPLSIGTARERGSLWTSGSSTCSIPSS